ncbi:malonic semialdehyde reductase [Aurantiacibacter xanthus]|uniref:Malonic semialdehyde reductase n=1 Tax=Aurantiacibacter xanthus TaxID=1784712 RepID=A0A3A1P483_9SPHN|nr:malonic semialdehyde reductase [Aurantiacibacter xanthus]RIV86096.1 malonic semialdehyde reductase [Aurantiacibacter xanthus]
MHEPLSDAALDQLFREARTCQWFDGRDVTDSQLAAIWDLMKMGPTSMNQLPARIVWCKSDEAKARLASHAAEGNVEKIRQAPVCAIIAMDEEFHEHLPRFAPHMDDARAVFAGEEKRAMRKTSAFRNGTLQGGYFIMAARAQGLDCGPMSGFNNAAVDADFFAEEPGWKSNFICSVGYGDPEKVFPRAPRPAFEDFNRLL